MNQTHWLYWLLGVNTLAFIAVAWDKSLARREAWRLSERSLWLLALLGGTPGLAFGMLRFRHKTRKPAFRLGVPLLGLAQLYVLYRFRPWLWL